MLETTITEISRALIVAKLDKTDGRGNAFPRYTAVASHSNTAYNHPKEVRNTVDRKRHTKTSPLLRHDTSG
jgi:hypothetical protein